MPAWLIDGLNVIGARPDGWWRDRTAAMRGLVARLDAWAPADEPVAVVFDGRPREVAARRVEVLFAPGPGPGAAEDLIAARVAGDGAPGLRVVTSDAELAARVRAYGVEVVGAGVFRRLLDEPPG